MRNDEYVKLIHDIQSNAGWTAILQSFARFANPQADTWLVDVGTGAGALADILRVEFGARVVGLDYEPRMLGATATFYPQTTYLAGDVYHMPFADNSVAMVTATNVLYLLDEPVPALREIARILNPNGQFVMLNPSPQMTIENATALADERGLTGQGRDQLINWGHIAQEHPRWSVADITQLFADAGLVVAETRERIGAGLALYVRGLRANQN